MERTWLSVHKNFHLHCIELMSQSVVNSHSTLPIPEQIEKILSDSDAKSPRCSMTCDVETPGS